jgi:hypothetical protein
VKAANGYRAAVATDLANLAHWCTASAHGTSQLNLRGNLDVRLVNTQATAIVAPLR